MKALAILVALAAPSPHDLLPPKVSEPAIAVCAETYEEAQSGFEADHDAAALFAKAVQSATQCISQGGGVDGLIVRAEARFALKNSQAALQDLADALKLSPFSAIAHFDRGMILLATGKNEAAAQDFTTDIEIDPTDADAHFERGWALALLGKNDGAVRDFDFVIAKYPDFAAAYRLRG